MGENIQHEFGDHRGKQHTIVRTGTLLELQFAVPSYQSKAATELVSYYYDYNSYTVYNMNDQSYRDAERGSSDHGLSTPAISFILPTPGQHELNEDNIMNDNDNSGSDNGIIDGDIDTFQSCHADLPSDSRAAPWKVRLEEDAPYDVESGDEGNWSSSDEDDDDDAKSQMSHSQADESIDPDENLEIKIAFGVVFWMLLQKAAAWVWEVYHKYLDKLFKWVKKCCKDDDHDAKDAGKLKDAKNANQANQANSNMNGGDGGKQSNTSSQAQASAAAGAVATMAVMASQSAAGAAGGT